MKNLKKALSLAVALPALLCVTGCDSPWQGNGALYIFEKGVSKCINVDSVSFVASRYSTYKIDGVEYIAQNAPEYYAGQVCE